MNYISSFGHKPVAHIPPIAIFDPKEFNQSLPASQYTLIMTDDLKHIYQEIARVQTYLHALIWDGDPNPSLVIQNSAKQAQPDAVHRIPPEILSLIFTHLVLPKNERGRICIPRLAEILLPGQICRSWREAAFATPILWSSLRFDLSPRWTEKMVEIGRVCLSRAKGEPLVIELDGSVEMEPIHPLLAILLAQAHQWHSLYAKASHVVQLQRLGARGQFPHLQKLEVNSILVRGMDVLDIFEMSRLRTIALGAAQVTNDWFHQTPAIPPRCLPWTQLQYISYEGVIKSCLEVLRLSPDLRTFAARVLPDQGMVADPRPQTRVKHTSLRDFSIRGYALDLLRYVEFSSLASFSCDAYGHGSGASSIFSEFVDASGIVQMLETMSFTAEWTRPRDERHLSCIIEILRHVPHVSRLSLIDADPNYERELKGGDLVYASGLGLLCKSLHWKTRKVAEKGAEEEARRARQMAQLNPRVPHVVTEEPVRISHGVLPRLKELVLKGRGAIQWEHLADMIGSRWRRVELAGGGLERLEYLEINKKSCTHARSARIPIRGHSIEDEIALARLRLYCDEGLRVSGNAIDGFECIECVEEGKLQERFPV